MRSPLRQVLPDSRTCSFGYLLLMVFGFLLPISNQQPDFSPRGSESSFLSGLWHVFRQVHAAELPNRFHLSPAPTYQAPNIIEKTKIVPPDQPRSASSSFTIISRLKAPLGLFGKSSRFDWFGKDDDRRTSLPSVEVNELNDVTMGGRVKVVIPPPVNEPVKKKHQAAASAAITESKRNGFYTISNGLVRFHDLPPEGEEGGSTPEPTARNPPPPPPPPPASASESNVLWELLRRPQKGAPALSQPSVLSVNSSTPSVSTAERIAPTPSDSRLGPSTEPPASSTTAPAAETKRASWMGVRVNPVTRYALATSSDNATVVFDRLIDDDNADQSTGLLLSLDEVDAYYPGYKQVMAIEPDRIIIIPSILTDLTSLNVSLDSNGTRRPPQPVRVDDRTVFAPTTWTAGTIYRRVNASDFKSKNLVDMDFVESFYPGFIKAMSHDRVAVQISIRTLTRALPTTPSTTTTAAAATSSTTTTTAATTVTTTSASTARPAAPSSRSPLKQTNTVAFLNTFRKRPESLSVASKTTTANGTTKRPPVAASVPPTPGATTPAADNVTTTAVAAATQRPNVAAPFTVNIVFGEDETMATTPAMASEGPGTSTAVGLNAPSSHSLDVTTDVPSGQAETVARPVLEGGGTPHAASSSTNGESKESAESTPFTLQTEDSITSILTDMLKLRPEPVTIPPTMSQHAANATGTTTTAAASVAPGSTGPGLRIRPGVTNFLAGSGVGNRIRPSLLSGMLGFLGSQPTASTGNAVAATTLATTFSHSNVTDSAPSNATGAQLVTDVAGNAAEEQVNTPPSADLDSAEPATLPSVSSSSSWLVQHAAPESEHPISDWNSAALLIQPPRLVQASTLSPDAVPIDVVLPTARPIKDSTPEPSLAVGELPIAVSTTVVPVTDSQTHGTNNGSALASLIMAHTAAMMAGKPSPFGGRKPPMSRTSQQITTLPVTMSSRSDEDLAIDSAPAVHVIMATAIPDADVEDLRFRSLNGVNNNNNNNDNSTSWGFPAFGKLVASAGNFLEQTFSQLSEQSRPLDNPTVDDTPVSSLNLRSEFPSLPPLPRFTCGQEISTGELVLTNPSYPDVDSESGRCFFRLVVTSPSVCQVRVDFRDSRMLLPRQGFCQDQYLSLSGSIVPHPFGVEGRFCGWNSDQHFYVELTEADENSTSLSTRAVDFQINTLVNGHLYRYSMAIQQIDCGLSNPIQAPKGCFQYFHSGRSGVVKSFNYDAGQYWNNQGYRICIRSFNRACSMALSSLDGEFGLHKSSSLQVPVNRSGVGAKACNRDYMWIPGASRSRSSSDDDRYCGAKFSERHGDTQPGVVVVRMDSSFHMMEFRTGTPRHYVPASHGPGYRISYMQMRDCPSSMLLEPTSSDDDPAPTTITYDYYDHQPEQIEATEHSDDQRLDLY